MKSLCRGFTKDKILSFIFYYIEANEFTEISNKKLFHVGLIGANTYLHSASTFPGLVRCRGVGQIAWHELCSVVIHKRDENEGLSTLWAEMTANSHNLSNQTINFAV